MKTSLLFAALVLGSSVGGGLLTAPRAFAQSTTLETSDAVPLDASGEPGWNDNDGRLDDAQPIQQPTTAAPTDTPKLPSNIPPAPGMQPNAQQQQNAQQQVAQQQVQTYPDDNNNGSTTNTVNNGPGQWVFTQQYGWVYAPYDRSYTYVTDDVSAASMYVYRPVAGWSWLIAPWVISSGPRPYWGNYGPYRYSYYSHPWFRARPHYGSVHYYGRPSYTYHAAPAPRAQYYYRGGGGGRIRGGVGGGWHGGGHGGGGGHHR